MNKIYYSPGGNRVVHAKIGDFETLVNGRTVMTPQTIRCCFGSAGTGRYATADPVVQAALEAHFLFGRDFILLEGKAAELLKDVRSLKEVVPEAAQIAEREALVKEARTLALRVDLVKATNQEIKAAIRRYLVEHQPVPIEVVSAPEPVVELPEVKETPQDVQVKRRGRPAKTEVRA